MSDLRNRLIQIKSGNRPLASYLSGEAIEEILSLVAEMEQAAELRGRIDELDNELPRTIGYDVIWANPQIHQNVTDRINELEQATKPEKGDSPSYGTIIHRKDEDGSGQQDL